jgi:hypothetical protein
MGSNSSESRQTPREKQVMGDTGKSQNNRGPEEASMKYNVNVPSKINKQKNFFKNITVVFCWRLEGR